MQIRVIQQPLFKSSVIAIIFLSIICYAVLNANIFYSDKRVTEHIKNTALNQYNLFSAETKNFLDFMRLTSKNTAASWESIPDCLSEFTVTSKQRNYVNTSYLEQVDKNLVILGTGDLLNLPLDTQKELCVLFNTASPIQQAINSRKSDARLYPAYFFFSSVNSNFLISYDNNEKLNIFNYYTNINIKQFYKEEGFDDFWVTPIYKNQVLNKQTISFVNTSYNYYGDIVGFYYRDFYIDDIFKHFSQFFTLKGINFLNRGDFEIYIEDKEMFNSKRIKDAWLLPKTYTAQSPKNAFGKMIISLRLNTLDALLLQFILAPNLLIFILLSTITIFISFYFYFRRGTQLTNYYYLDQKNKIFNQNGWDNYVKPKLIRHKKYRYKTYMFAVDFYYPSTGKRLERTDVNLKILSYIGKALQSSIKEPKDIIHGHDTRFYIICYQKNWQEDDVKKCIIKMKRALNKAIHQQIKLEIQMLFSHFELTTKDEVRTDYLIQTLNKQLSLQMLNKSESLINNQIEKVGIKLDMNDEMLKSSIMNKINFVKLETEFQRNLNREVSEIYCVDLNYHLSTLVHLALSTHQGETDNQTSLYKYKQRIYTSHQEQGVCISLYLYLINQMLNLLFARTNLTHNEQQCLVKLATIEQHYIYNLSNRNF